MYKLIHNITCALMAVILAATLHAQKNSTINYTVTTTDGRRAAVTLNENSGRGTCHITATMQVDDAKTPLAHYTSSFATDAALTPLAAEQTLLSPVSPAITAYSWNTPLSIKTRRVTTTSEEISHGGACAPVRDILNLLWWLRRQPYDGFSLPSPQSIATSKGIHDVVITRYARAKMDLLPGLKVPIVAVRLTVGRNTDATLILTDNDERLPVAFFATFPDIAVNCYLTNAEDLLMAEKPDISLDWLVGGISKQEPHNATIGKTTQAWTSTSSNGFSRLLSTTASSIQQMANGIEQLNNMLNL